MEPAVGPSSATTNGTTLQIFACNKNDSTQQVSDKVTGNRSKHSQVWKISDVSSKKFNYDDGNVISASYSYTIICHYRKIFFQLLIISFMSNLSLNLYTMIFWSFIAHDGSFQCPGLIFIPLTNTQKLDSCIYFNIFRRYL